MKSECLSHTISYSIPRGETKEGTILATIAFPDDMSTTPQFAEYVAEMIGNLDVPEAKSKSNHFFMEDPAVAKYRNEPLSINVDALLENSTISEKNTFLLESNIVNLRGKNLDEYDLLWKQDINLATIRKLNLSGSKNTNVFLRGLFSHCRTINSLACIDVENTDVTMDTLELWKGREAKDFNGPLIRPSDKISQGYHVARLYVRNVINTPIMKETSITEKLKLQRIADNRLETLYADEGFHCLGFAHLQLVLE